MDAMTALTPPPRRPRQAGVHRLALAVAAFATVATVAGAGAISGGPGPGSAAAASATSQSADLAAAVAPVPEILVHTIYVPAPQPTAAPQLPVKVIVIHKQSHGDDGNESGGD